MPRLPRIAYSAALPVSPEVAPKMFNSSLFLASAYSNRLPSNCIAMSLNASVGPFDSACRIKVPCGPLSSVRSGVISSLDSSARALRYTAGVYVFAVSAFRSASGMSVANLRRIS
jgi:hypothetical protein